MKIKKMVCIALTAAMLLSTVSAFAMSTYSFDSGMRKGINYFNQGLYYEARDEFQWFCDYNWGKMNSGQQQYALDYLNGAKLNIKNTEYANNHLTQKQFDDGMRAGINYFNKGMFYESRDEFQWFCDYNWGKMNSGQRQYALNYLNAAKKKVQDLNTYTGNYHGGLYVDYGKTSYWQYNLSITNATSNSLYVKKFYMSQSALEVKNLSLYKQNDGSYSGYGVQVDNNESIYLKITIYSGMHIKLTYRTGNYTETFDMYK